VTSVKGLLKTLEAQKNRKWQLQLQRGQQVMNVMVTL
jgi:hypothetical protein